MAAFHVDGVILPTTIVDTEVPAHPSGWYLTRADCRRDDVTDIFNNDYSKVTRNRAISLTDAQIANVIFDETRSLDGPRIQECACQHRACNRQCRCRSRPSPCNSADNGTYSSGGAGNVRTVHAGGQPDAPAAEARNRSHLMEPLISIFGATHPARRSTIFQSKRRPDR
jgi:hypothetical protein